jgi:hypothetical protein
VDWDAIGAIGEIGGAIAVVVTLLFLARQVKDAAKQFTLASSAEATDLYSNAWWPIYQNPENLRIWTRGQRDPTSLDQGELEIFLLFMTRLMAVYDTVAEHYVEGAISEDKMMRYMKFTRQFLTSPGGLLWREREPYTMFSKGLELMDL